MGIRKSLESQSQTAESGNIKNFVIETEEPTEVIFDPEALTSEQDWEEMKNYFWKKKRKHAETGFKYAVFLAILFPEKFDQLNIIKLKNSSIDRGITRAINAYELVQTLSQAKILLSGLDDFEKSEQEGLGGEDIEDLIRNTVESDTFGIGLTDKLEQLARIKLLYPKTDFSNYWKNILAEINEYKQDLKSLTFRDESTLIGAAEIVAYTKIIFSDKLDTKALKKELQECIKIYQEFLQDKNWDDAVLLGACLRIAFSKEIKITDQGLEIIMPEKKTQKTDIPPRPERREF